METAKGINLSLHFVHWITGGQGVHREVESEGFAEKYRAVIEGATPSMNRSSRRCSMMPASGTDLKDRQRMHYVRFGKRSKRVVSGSWMRISPSFFGTGDHDKLVTLIAKRVSDRRVLGLIRSMLTAGCMIVIRLRKDAALFDGPLPAKTLTRGRPRK